MEYQGDSISESEWFAAEMDDLARQDEEEVEDREVSQLEALIKEWEVAAKKGKGYAKQAGDLWKPLAAVAEAQTLIYTECAHQLRAALKTGIWLPEVDLTGEIAEGNYWCLIRRERRDREFSTYFKNEWSGRSYYKGEWFVIGKVLKAYGPLPEPEGKE